MDGTGLIAAVVAELERGDVDLRAIGLGWARAAPVVAIVPAFGLRALPAPVRAMMGLAMAACIAPAIRPEASQDPWAWGLVMAVLHGLPIAIAAAIPLWAATMAGGAIDAMRSSGDTTTMPPVEGKPTLFGVPMALLASTIFLSTGGPARVVEALARPALAPDLALVRAAFDLAAGIQIAVAVAAPVLAASVVVEVSTALIARAASPAQIHSLLAPLRSFAILAVAALTLDRMIRVIALWVDRSPG
jgi:flagellar biosynthetic protein FliR